MYMPLCETCLFYCSCMFTIQGNLLNGYRQAKETAVIWEVYQLDIVHYATREEATQMISYTIRVC